MTSYSFQPVNYPDDRASNLVSINNKGEVIGSTSGSRISFTYQNGFYNPIDYPDSAYTFATGLNYSGEIVGNYLPNSANDDQGPIAFSYNGLFSQITPPKAISTNVTAVNDLGQIVGSYLVSDDEGHAFFYSNGAFYNVDRVARFAAVNINGQAVGSGPDGGVLYHDGVTDPVNFPGAANTIPTDINNAGTIVGRYFPTDDSLTQGFVDNGGVFTQIIIPGADFVIPTAINNQGEIVGNYGDAAGRHGFTDINGVITTIDYPGADGTSVADVNDLGQIIGNSVTHVPGTGSFLATPDCFVAGTAIRTECGDVAVETLAAGDIVVTVGGAMRPVKWVGSRTLVASMDALHACPIRIAAHAFGPNQPGRDLYLSPGHPVLVGADEDGEGGHLVPIMCLVNGLTIERVQMDTVTYWHVELDTHDVLLAEGLPAESYFDTGNRTFFTGASDHRLHDPDLVFGDLAGRCRPVAIDGAAVEAERRRLDVVFGTRLSAACDWPQGENAAWG